MLCVILILTMTSTVGFVRVTNLWWPLISTIIAIVSIICGKPKCYLEVYKLENNSNVSHRQPCGLGWSIDSFSEYNTRVRPGPSSPFKCLLHTHDSPHPFNLFYSYLIHPGLGHGSYTHMDTQSHLVHS